MSPSPPPAGLWDRPLSRRAQAGVAVVALSLLLVSVRALVGRWDHVGLLLGALVLFVAVRVLALRLAQDRGWRVPLPLARLAVIALGAGVGVLAALLAHDGISLRGGLWWGTAWGAASALNDVLHDPGTTPAA